MKRMLIAALAALAFVGPAFAADMPVKAPPRIVNPFISYLGSSFYWFGGAFGGGSTVDLAVPANQTRLNATGGGLSAGGGYMWGHGTTWTAVDVRGNYDALSASGVCAGAACAFRQRSSIEARVKYGADSSVLANVIPNFGLSGLFDVLPQIPSGASTPSHPYVFAYGEISQDRTNVAAVGLKRWRDEVGGGVGMVHQLGANKAIDTWAKCGFDPGSIGTTFKLGTTCKGGVDLIF